VRDEPLVVWSAHEFDTAKEALNDLESLIDGSDMLRKRVKLTARNNVGSHGATPEIRLTSGARLKVKTRTSGGGRGLSGRKVILDEGYALQAGQVGALMPIMLAQPDPQIYIGSSACRPESAVLWDIVQRGRAGRDPRMVYAEWCAPDAKDVCADGERCDHARGRPGCGCDDEGLLTSVHSAITRGRILVQTVRDLRESMPPDEYGREIMGWHDEPVDMGGRKVPLTAWVDCEDSKSRMIRRVVLAWEVSWDRSNAAIAAAGFRADGLPQVELIEYRVGQGTDWVPGRVREIVGRQPVEAAMFYPAGPGGSLETDIAETLPAKFGEPKPLNGRDMAHGCGLLYDKITSKGLRHLGDDRLVEMLKVAVPRSLGDGWVWDLKRSAGDVCGLQAVTAALWGLNELVEPPPPPPPPAMTTENIRSETNALASAGF
jgi:hypothetical protein